MDTARKPMTISRRNFLGGLGLLAASAAGTASLAGCTPSAPSQPQKAAGSASQEATDTPSFMNAPEPVEQSKIAETVDVDVLVIGAGISGSATASRCAEKGLKVALVEKLETPRAIGLDYGVINPSIIAETGLDPVDPYEIARDHMEKSCNMCRGDKVYRFVSKSGEAADWWFEKAESYGFEPQVMAMKSNSDHYKNNYIVELWHKGVNLAEEENCYAPMEEMLHHVSEEVQTSGGIYSNNTEALYLLQDANGAVTGAVCKKDNSYVQYNASKGVVLAAGDYAMDEEMLRHYTTWDYDSFDSSFFANESTGTGDGHKMGLWAGAHMQETPNPLMIFMGYAYGYLRVNKNGERYVNEDSGYVGGGTAQMLQPEAASWAIWDDKWREEIPDSLNYGGGMSWDQDFRRINDEWTAEREEAGAFSWETEGGVLMKANTIDELADTIGFTGEAKTTFLATVKRYNQLAKEGDCDFGKRPELMTAIEQGPFYALKMTLGLAVSVGGLVTNADSECLNANGKAIPGLFAVGNNAGGLFGVDYNEVTVPGISVGRSVTFGYLLGNLLAEK